MNALAQTLDWHHGRYFKRRPGSEPVATSVVSEPEVLDLAIESNLEARKANGQPFVFSFMPAACGDHPGRIAATS
jgi:hypothetical protein